MLADAGILRVAAGDGGAAAETPPPLNFEGDVAKSDREVFLSFFGFFGGVMPPSDDQLGLGRRGRLGGCDAGGGGLAVAWAGFFGAVMMPRAAWRSAWQEAMPRDSASLRGAARC